MQVRGHGRISCVEPFLGVEDSQIAPRNKLLLQKLGGTIRTHNIKAYPCTVQQMAQYTTEKYDFIFAVGVNFHYFTNPTNFIEVLNSTINLLSNKENSCLVVECGIGGIINLAVSKDGVYESYNIISDYCIPLGLRYKYSEGRAVPCIRIFKN